MGESQHTFDPVRLNQYAQDIKELVSKGIEVAIVIGGGNIFRGLRGSESGTDRVQGDYMGMLATIINSMAMQDVLEKAGVPSKILSGLPVDPVAEKMSSKKAIRYLENDLVILIGGGTGNPFFTTDSAAVLRALEIRADVILKGTRVDGIYSADPEKDPTAVKYDSISFADAYSNGLKIMDLTAFTLCMENNLPIIVFNMNVIGNLVKVIDNDKIGTLVGN